MAVLFSLPRSSSKVLSLVMSVFFLVGFIVGIFILPNTAKEEKNKPEQQVEGLQTTIEPTSIVISSLPMQDTDKGPEATVLKVIDGDTLHVNLNGQKEVIRVIGLNTPETVDPRRPVECFGKEASQKAKEMLTGEIVQLETDPTQDTRDKYGRLLRFIWLDGGSIDYGKYMISEGFAYEYTYETPYKYKTAYKQAQQNAEATRKGLWGGSCETSLQKTTVEKSQDKDCKDFTTHQEAQDYFVSKGGSSARNIDNLDTNGDGLACETLP